MWYCAHVVYYVDTLGENQEEFPVYENIHLLEATGDVDVVDKATELGRATEGDSFRWKNADAKLVFAGVRKIILCQSDESDENKPKSGDELTYSEFVVNGKENLVKLAAGDPVDLHYKE